MLPLSTTAKQQIKAERFKNVVFADEVLHVDEYTLNQVIDNGNYQIQKALKNPYFKHHQHLINTLISQSLLPREWQKFFALDKANDKFKHGKKPTTAYLDKYKLVFSRSDNRYHLNNKDGKLSHPKNWLSDLATLDPTAPINSDLDFKLQQFADEYLDFEPRPVTPPPATVPSKHRFDPADIVEVNEPLPDFLRIGSVVFSKELSQTKQTIEKTSSEKVAKNTPATPVFSKFKVVYSKKRQNTPFIEPKPISNNLDKQNNLTPHQYYKYKSVEYQKSLLPKKHPMQKCMKVFLESLKIYVDENSDTHQIHTIGGCRCHLATCVYCNTYDGQQENIFAERVQETLLEQGYSQHKSTLTYPHKNPDIEQDLPSLATANTKFLKEFKRLLSVKLSHIDIKMNVCSLETPINKKNGINAHFNYFWTVKGHMTSSEKRTFARLQYQAWLSSLVLVGLVAKGDKPEHISHVKFNDNNALDYITKYENSYHTPEQIPEIKQRFDNGESISKFELLSLGQYGELSQSYVTKTYRALVNAIGAKQLIKYSPVMNKWLLEHGLMFDDNAQNQDDSEPLDRDPDITPANDLQGQETHGRAIPEPVTVVQFGLFDVNPDIIVYKSRKQGAGRKGRTHKHPFDPVLQQTFAPELEKLLQQAIKRAERRRYRRITDPDKSNWYLLADFSGMEWQSKYKDYEQLSMINQLKQMYLDGLFPRKPQGMGQDNPRPS